VQSHHQRLYRRCRPVNGQTLKAACKHVQIRSHAASVLTFALFLRRNNKWSKYIGNRPHRCCVTHWLRPALDYGRRQDWRRSPLCKGCRAHIAKGASITGGIWTPSNTKFLGRPTWVCRKRHLDRFSRFCIAQTLMCPTDTDRDTDYRDRNVCSKRPHLALRAGNAV